MSSTQIAKSQNNVKVSTYDYDTKISTLTPEELTKYQEIGSKINTKDITSIQVYGSELNSVISKNGNALIENARTNNNDEVFTLVNDLMSQLNIIDYNELDMNSKWKAFLRRLPIIKTMVNSIENILMKYDSISENLDTISKKIDVSKVIAMRDNSTLQTIFDNNVSYIGQIRELILGAKVKMQEIDAKIQDMDIHPNNYETYEIKDMDEFKINLEKRISDMETTEYVLNQNLLQIRATQGNNIAISNKADNIVNNIIPLWRNQLSIYITLNNQKNSIEAQRKITETTNRLISETAKALKINSIETAKANEEQVISLDTLRNTTNDLIETINKVKEIHEEGAQRRKEIETSLQEFSKDLQNAINNV